MAAEAGGVTDGPHACLPRSLGGGAFIRTVVVFRQLPPLHHQVLSLGPAGTGGSVWPQPLLTAKVASPHTGRNDGGDVARSAVARGRTSFRQLTLTKVKGSSTLGPGVLSVFTWCILLSLMGHQLTHSSPRHSLGSVSPVPWLACLA